VLAPRSLGGRHSAGCVNFQKAAAAGPAAGSVPTAPGWAAGQRCSVMGTARVAKGGTKRLACDFCFLEWLSDLVKWLLGAKGWTFFQCLRRNVAKAIAHKLTEVDHIFRIASCSADTGEASTDLLFKSLLDL